MYDENKIIGFCGVIHHPHPINKKIKSVTRLVILPDYQGIGLGRKFLNIISSIYTKNGYDFKIQTSAKNLIQCLIKDDTWNLVRYGKVQKLVQTSKVSLDKSLSDKRITATFFKKN